MNKIISALCEIGTVAMLLTGFVFFSAPVIMVFVFGVHLK